MNPSGRESSAAYALFSISVGRCCENGDLRRCAVAGRMASMAVRVLGYDFSDKGRVRVGRLRIVGWVAAALLSLIIASGSGFRAAWAFAHAQEDHSGPRCATCAERLKGEQKSPNGSFADHTAVAAGTIGAAFVCIVGAARSFHSMREHRLRD